MRGAAVPDNDPPPDGSSFSVVSTSSTAEIGTPAASARSRSSAGSGDTSSNASTSAGSSSWIHPQIVASSG